MPFVRLNISCGYCRGDTSIIFGNPQMATKPEHSPFRVKSSGAVVFTCSECSTSFNIPCLLDDSAIKSNG
jgi:hypothetical protein